MKAYINVFMSQRQSRTIRESLEDTWSDAQWHMNETQVTGARCFIQRTSRRMTGLWWAAPSSPLHWLHRLFLRLLDPPRFSLKIFDVVDVVEVVILFAVKNLGLHFVLSGIRVNLRPFFLMGPRCRRQSGRLSNARSSVFFNISSNVKGSESEFLFGGSDGRI